MTLRGRVVRFLRWLRTFRGSRRRVHQAAPVRPATVAAMPRGNTQDGTVDMDAVAARVRAALHRETPPMPEPSPLDDLPDDPLADLEATRAVLNRL